MDNFQARHWPRNLVKLGTGSYSVGQRCDGDGDGCFVLRGCHRYPRSSSECRTSGWRPLIAVGWTLWRRHARRSQCSFEERCCYCCWRKRQRGCARRAGCRGRRAGRWPPVTTAASTPSDWHAGSQL